MGKTSGAKRPIPEIIEALRGVSCATLWGILGDAYHMRHINPLFGDCKVVGPAATIKYAEIDPMIEPGKMLHEIERHPNPMYPLFEAMRPGDVVIGAALGHDYAGIFGDCYATAFKARGAAALVSDASVRDSSGIRELDLPVFTRAPATPLSSRGGGVFPVEENVTVICDGVTVKPGDIVVGDGDGIIVIPREWADDVARKAEAKEKLEALTRKLLLEGTPLRECYPHLKKEHVKQHGLEEYWDIVYSDHEG
jgi:regulator of RNase E activity RraA